MLPSKYHHVGGEGSDRWPCPEGGRDTLIHGETLTYLNFCLNGLQIQGFPWPSFGFNNSLEFTELTEESVLRIVVWLQRLQLTAKWKKHIGFVTGAYPELRCPVLVAPKQVTLPIHPCVHQRGSSADPWCLQDYMGFYCYSGVTG